MTRDFTHLHVHTSFSILDGVSRRDDLIKICKERGMANLAITDHGNMFNAVSFYKSCLDANIKGIIGEEFYIAPDSRTNRSYDTKAEANRKAEEGDLSYSAYHLTILAKNKIGYHNLKKLSTIAWREGFYRKPRIDLDILNEHKEGLIVLSGCLASMTSRLIVNGQKDKALELLDKERKMFGEDFYIEVMHHGIGGEEDIVNSTLIDISKKHGIPLAMTNDSHYTHEDDSYAHEVALCVGINKSIHDPTHFKFNGSGYHFRTADEMYAVAAVAGIPDEALTNTMLIASKVEDYGLKLTSNKHPPQIPLFRNENGEALTSEACHALLETKVWSGLIDRKLIDSQVHKDRVIEELTMIKKKNFSSYFLIIADIIDFMRNHNILPPIGRGSSLGSLACYCLYITGLDPVYFGIPFSRFINDGRKDLPDIDTDISQENRKKVIDYIVSRYGKDRVAQIITFQSMAAKASIDNVGRALGVPNETRRHVGRIVGETEKDDKIADVLDYNKEAAAVINSVPNWGYVSSALEGNHKNTGIHAAGIVICNEEIENQVPLIRDSKEGYRVTQYDMKNLQELGLLKLDMLGLKTIDLIQHTLELIDERHGLMFDFHRFPLDDKATYNLVSTGKYVSVFQYDSSGIRATAKQLKPEKFDHLVALNALYRPGPMLPDETGKSILQRYIDRRHGREEIEVWHEDLRDVFSDTMGLCIYQESLMKMSKVMAGFNDTEADEYRAAVGKKDKVKFDAANAKFKDRAVKLGRDPAFMDSLIKRLEGFARYGWNVGHCLRWNTKVLTCSRGYVNIKDVKPGEEVWSIGHKTGHFFRNRVKNVINNGIRPLSRISAGDRSVDCTDAHRFLVAKKGYVHAAELNSGHSLKVLKDGAARAYLNINMTTNTNSDKIPFGVGLDDISGNNVMYRQSGPTTTKDTASAVTFSDRVAHGLTNFMRFSASSDVGSAQKFINATRINEDALRSKSFGNSLLTGESAINNVKYPCSNVRGDGVYFIAAKAPFFKLSGQTCLTGLEWEHAQDVVATMASMVPTLNERSIKLIRAGRISADVTSSRLGPSTNNNIGPTFNTSDMFSAAIDDMGITIPFDDVGRGCEDLPALNANIVSSIHGTIIDDRNVDSNITLNESDEVYDLEMELDANFIANDIVVHNSMAYSYISFVTAYLEAHYPIEYYTTLLNVNLDDNDELKKLLAGILQHGVSILPPDANHSKEKFNTDGNHIYMGLYSIRQFGDTALKPMMEEREAHGPYKDYLDFCVRMGKIGKVSSLIKKNMIKAGAFRFDKSMTELDKHENTDIIQDVAKKFSEKGISQEIIRQTALDKIIKKGLEWPNQDLLEHERSVLNFYISSHPVTEYVKLFSLFEDVNFITPSQLQSQQVGNSVILFGVVEAKTMGTTKKGDPYLKLKVGDQLASSEVMVWSPKATDVYNNVPDKVLVFVSGVVRDDKFRPGENQLSVSSVTQLRSGIPISGFYGRTKEDAKKVASILGIEDATISDEVRHLGSIAHLRTTAYIQPKHYAELSTCIAKYCLNIG